MNPHHLPAEQGSRQLLAPREQQEQSPLRGAGGGTPEEEAKACEGLVQLVEAHVDFDALLEVAALARVPPCADQALPAPPQRSPAAAEGTVRIGIAHDAAFSLYYSECGPPSCTLNRSPQTVCMQRHGSMRAPLPCSSMHARTCGRRCAPVKKAALQGA